MFITKPALNVASTKGAMMVETAARNVSNKFTEPAKRSLPKQPASLPPAEIKDSPIPELNLLVEPLTNNAQRTSVNLGHEVTIVDPPVKALDLIA